MSAPTLSIVTPTQGRPTLERMLDSGVGQLAPGDQWLVVVDRHEMADIEEHRIAQRLHRYGPQVCGLTHDAGRHSWGHDQANHGMARATGNWLVFQDDDDGFAPGALDAIRHAIAEHGPAPLLFRFEAYFGDRPLVWQRKGVIAPGMIGGHCLVVPNDPARLGRWEPHHAGDFDFVYGTLAKWRPVEPVWIDTVISIQRPA
jgi:hypothetical protein